MLELINVKKSFKKIIKTWKWYNDIFFSKYENIEILKWLNFKVNQWEKIAFIWPNWAWKSTTIKCILWILHYDEWEIKLFWKDPKKYRKQINFDISSAFWQRSSLLYHLPLIDSFDFFKIIYEIDNKKYNDRLKFLAEKFQIMDILNVPVRKLSLWQRMRWEIICSLLHSPKAIFLDEPTIWLDIIAKQTFHELLNEIHKQENITIFLTSHDLKDIEVLCDRAIIINYWEIIYDWTIFDLHKQYSTKKNINYKIFWDNKRTHIEFNTQQQNLSQIIKTLFDKHDIEDLQIKNIELEEIITKFYKK